MGGQAAAEPTGSNLSGLSWTLWVSSVCWVASEKEHNPSIHPPAAGAVKQPLIAEINIWAEFVLENERERERKEKPLQQKES